MTGREDLARVGSPLALPVFERIAPALPPAELAARIEAATQPDDVVIDPFGRGGWTARVALGLGRRALSIESSPLTRLLADVVVRPPDLRHLDAAFQSVGAAPLGTSSVRAWISDQFATRCTTCSRNVPLEELVWEPPREGGSLRPVRRSFRCVACLDKRGRGNELRSASVQPADLERATLPLAIAEAVREELRRRFPARGRAGVALADQVLAIHSERQLGALHAILVRIEGDLRASQVTSALKLAFLHAVLPSSRFNASRGRPGIVRISDGQLRPPASTGWRERNPWRAFEEGYGLVRGFVQALDEGPLAAVQARITDPLDGLLDAPPMISLRIAEDDAFARLEEEGRALAPGDRARVRLMLGQQPPEWTPTRLAESYVLTAWALGSDATRALPLDPLFDGSSRPPARTPVMRRALAAVAPALGPEGRGVLLIESEGAHGLAAAALAGAGARWRIEAARLAEPGQRPVGEVDLIPPRGRLGAPARSRSGQVLATVARGAGDPGSVAGQGVLGGPQSIEGRFSRSEAGRAITDAAVAALQARGEPAGRDRLLGDLLVALDRSGQLRRFAVTGEHPDAADVRAADLRSADGQAPSVGGTPAAPEAAAASGNGEARPERAASAGAASARALLDLIDSELERSDQRRLARAEAGRIWLADPREEAAAATPISDRVEWAIFSLLTGPERPTERALRLRLAALFRGADEPPDRLVDACLASYALPVGGRDELASRDDLQLRVMEHSRIIGLLAELGHRMRLHVAIAAREHGRRVNGRPLSAYLEPDEREPQLSFLGRAGAAALEEVDCIWYARPRFAFLFEVEWTAMLGDPILRRGRRIPPDDRLVRFLVVVPERVELVRAKLDDSPVLRRAIEEGNWHILRTDALQRLAESRELDLEQLEPYLGLEPTALGPGSQMPLFVDETSGG